MKTDPGEGTEYTVNRRKRVGVAQKERERVQLHFESCGWGFVLCAGRAGDWEETDRDNRKACTAADGMMRRIGGVWKKERGKSFREQ